MIQLVQLKTFHENGDFVKLTFYFERIPKTSVLSEETILEMTRKSEILRPSDISSEYNVSRNTISRRVDGLVKKKMLKRHRKGAGIFYTLVPFAIATYKKYISFFKEYTQEYRIVL